MTTVTTKDAAKPTITIDACKKAIEGYVPTAFSSETFPHGLTWKYNGDVAVYALAAPVRQAIETLAFAGCYAAAIMVEAFGTEREDIISIVLDHPDGVVVGRAPVNNASGEGEERVGPIEWTTDLEPLSDKPIRFPRFSQSGKFVRLRVKPA